MYKYRHVAMVAAVLAMAEMVSAGPVITTDLIAYYSFDNASNLGEDTSGNNYNSTSITGTIAQAVGYGNVGGSAYFASGTNYIDLPYADIVAEGNSPTGNFTLAAWVKIIGANPYEIFSARTNQSTNNGMVLHAELRPDGGYYRFVTRDAAAVTIKDFKSYTAPESNCWHHVAMTYDAAALDMSIYLDGSLLESVKLASAPDLGVWDIGARIGATADNASRPFIGYMDELYLFKGTLTASQVHELASVPEPSMIAMLVVACMAGLLYWWKR